MIVRAHRRGLRLVVSILLAAMLAVSGLGINTRPAAAAGSCPPNDSQTTIVSEQRCVGELMRTVRQRLSMACVLDPKAVSTANPLYSSSECRLGSGVQAEAIAQARLLAHYNAEASALLFDDPPAVGGIAPNAQWEVGLSGGRRVDALFYDRRPGGGDLQLVELKQRTTSGSEADADRQLFGYLTDLPQGAAGRQNSRHQLGGYEDFFRVLVRDCTVSGAPTRIVAQYQVEPSVNFAGVLMIDRSDQVTPCPQPPDPPLDPVPTEVPTDVDVPEDTDDPFDPPIVVHRPGSDDDGDGWDDFYEDLREHIPEVFDVPAPEINANTGTILVGSALAALGLACLFLAPEVCVPALAAEGGAATVEAAVGALVTALAGLVGWNLWGDPHVVTLDRLQYDLQAVGEFHLLEFPQAGIDVQGRFVASGSQVSVLDRIATEVGDHRVEIGRTWAKVDGVDANLAVGGAIALGEGAVLARDGRGFALVWPNLVGQPLALLMSGDRLGFAAPPASLVGPARGLLGNHDGDPGNDLALRDGTPLPANPSPTLMHGTFADSWRVSDEEALFTYAAGQSTATFTDLSFPANIVTVGDFPSSEVEAATGTCSQAGVEPGPQFDACVLDVLVTGDDTYAASAALVSDVIVASGAAELDGSGRVLVDFEGEVPPNFTSARYESDAATSRVAGPVFDRGGYRFYLRNVGRHDGMTLEADLYTFGPVATDAAAQSVALTVNRQVFGSALFDDGPPRLSGMAGTLTVTGSGVTAGGAAFTRYRLTAPLGVRGEALDVELTPSGFSGVLGTSLGIDNLSVALDVPPAQEFAADVPFSVPGAAGSGMSTAEGAGVLESAGAADVIEFAVPAAAADRAHVISTRSCTTSLTFELTASSTGARIGRWAETCGRVTSPTLPEGTYRLSVTPALSRYAGTYAIDVFVAPDPQQFDLAVGTVVRDAVPGAGAGNLETPASRDVYRFHTDGGDLALDNRACTPGEGMELRAAGGTTTLAWAYCGDQTFGGLAAGDYQLEVSTDAPTGGSYSFQLYPTPVPPQDYTVSLPLTVATSVPATGAGELETKDSVDRYTFTTDAAAPVYLDLQSCLDNGKISWRLIDTSGGSAVASGGCSDTQTATLPAGTYRLDISSADQGIGGYQLQAWQVPMAPQTFDVTLPMTVAPDQPGPGAGNLETKASVDVYRFTIPDDQTAVYVEQVACAVDDMLTWRLVNVVSGRQVAVANGTCEDRQIRQAAAGTYRLEVTALGEAHGSYQLRVAASAQGSPVIGHVPQATAWYGQPVPIDATTTCETPEGCFARLHYRASGETSALLDLPAGGWAVQELVATGPAIDGLVSWHGQIPSQVVTTTGVDYYLTAGDGDDRSELPVAVAAPLGQGGLTTGGTATVLDAPHFHVATVSPPLLVHSPPLYAQADTDLPIEVRASCSSANCTARLHYRTSAGLLPGLPELRGDPGWPTVTMTSAATSPLGNAGTLVTFRATIPGGSVDTRGVDYYIDVTDTHTTAYWPGTTYEGYYAPRDGMRTAYQTVHVLEPPHIVHAPPASTGYRAATPITATANCPATRTCTAHLYYRTTINGDWSGIDFASAPMTVTRLATLVDNDTITVAGVIPGTVADTRGIDYFFRIDDGSTTTWYPGTGQVSGYVNVDGTRVAYQHIRVLEPPHIIHTPTSTTEAFQPYTITAQATCATELCTMTLRWRNDLTPGEPDRGWHTTTMTLIGSPIPTPAGPLRTYTATIPAERVTTRGIAYYLEANDGYVHDYSPGIAYWGALFPMDGEAIEAPVDVNGSTVYVGAHLVRVLEPPHLLHAPALIVERGAPLPLSATSNCSTPMCTATLTWTDHDGVTQNMTMVATRVLEGDAVNPALPGDTWQYAATIPAADTTGTVNYRITVTDGYTTDATPDIQALVYYS